MLLIKQCIISAFKNKVQMIVFTILILLSSLLGTTFYVTSSRLIDGNNYMGYGNFHYDYSFNYIASGYDANNVQTISPWYTFDADYASTGDGVAELDFPTLTIGKADSALLPINLAVTNFTPGKTPTALVSDLDFQWNKKDVENGVFGSLYCFNFKSSSFLNSTIGQIYQRDIWGKPISAQKTKAITLISNYMDMINNSQITTNLKLTIIDFINQNYKTTGWDLNQAAEFANKFINGSTWDPSKPTAFVSSTDSWEVKGILNDTQNIPTIEYEKSTNKEIRNDVLTYNGSSEKWGLRGNIGVIVHTINKTVQKPSNFEFYYANSQNPEIIKSNQAILEKGSFRVRNLDTYDFFDTFAPFRGYKNQDFFNLYYNLIGFLTNFKIATRNQAVVWSATGKKYRFNAAWSSIIDSEGKLIPIYDDPNQIKIIQQSTYWDSLKGMRDTVIVSPQYAKANGQSFDSKISVGQSQELYIGAYGGDTQDIYPTIYDDDVIPSTASQAILYISHPMFQELFGENNATGYLNGEFQDVSRGLLTHTGNIKNKDVDFLNFKKYLADNVNDLRNVTTAINNNTDNNLNNNSIFKTYADNVNVNRRYTLLNSTIKLYLIIAIICVILFLLVISFVSFILLKKIIEKQKTQIGILKANGYTTFEISSAYLLYLLIPIIISVPIGWALGLALQIPIMDIFNNYFIIPIKFSANAFPLLYFFLLFIILISLIVFLTCYTMLGKSVLLLVNANQNIKPNLYLSRLVSRIKFKRFTNKFRLILISVSLKNIMLFMLTFIVTTAIFTLSLLIPTTINNISREYYKNIKYKTEYNLNNVQYNNPLSRYALYNMTSPLPEFDENNPTPDPIGKDMAFAQYVRNSSRDSWQGVNNPEFQQYYSEYVTNMLLYNIAQLKGTNISLAMLDYIVKQAPVAKQDDVANLLQTIVCNMLPQVFGQEAIDNIPNGSYLQKWTYCVEKATNTILPSEIKEMWSCNSTIKNRFSFGFGSLPFDRQHDELYTGYQAKLMNINGQDVTDRNILINSYGYTKSNLNKMNLNNDDIFKYDPNNKTIPVLINQAAVKTYGLGVGDKINFGTMSNALQYLGKDNKMHDIKSEWWYFKTDDEMGNQQIYQMDLSKFTYSPQNDNSQQIWGYNVGTTNHPNIIPYHQMKDIMLKIPKNLIDVSFWNKTPIKINSNTGQTETHLFCNETGDCVENGIVTSTGDSYLIRIYDLGFDHTLNNLGDLVSSGFPTTWYNSAMTLGLLKSTSLDKIPTYNLSDYQYQVIGIQNTYDYPRIFLDQQYANKVLGYPTDVNANSQPYWFNGKYSTNEKAVDQTERYILNSTNGNYSMLNFKDNFAPAITNADYVGMKQQILIKLTSITIEIATLFIVLTIITAIIIIFLMTDAFLAKYTKFIATLRIQGYAVREINSMILGMFIPFVLIGWALGFGLLWVIVKEAVSAVLLNASLVIPFTMSYYIIPIVFGIIMFMFAITFVISSKKILAMNVQFLSTVNDE